MEPQMENLMWTIANVFVCKCARAIEKEIELLATAARMSCDQMCTRLKITSQESAAFYVLHLQQNGGCETLFGGKKTKTAFNTMKTDS